MHKVLVSSCLLGDPVRYDGTAASSHHPVLDRWKREGRVVPCCPEVAAGLPVPRPPMELREGDGISALERAGKDLTDAFVAGARDTLALCRRLGIRVAVLKERSPSCGSSSVYDGSFMGNLIPGQGITTAVLRAHGIKVFSEHQWEEAEACLADITSSRKP